jgi:thioredoxin reductase
MTYLRSPEVHHLHYDPWSLRTFAETRHGKPHANYIPLYKRPTLALFQTYSRTLIERYDLAALRLKGRAVGLQRVDGGWRVETDSGNVDARRVILAMGASERLNIPDWAQPLMDAGIPVNHIFESDFSREAIADWNEAVVVGGGISAAQTALALAARSPGSVTMLSRHAMRVHDFDADPCWVTRLCLERFHRTTDYDQRRAMITEARYTGSIPPDIREQLLDAINAGKLRLRIGEVTAASRAVTTPTVTLTLSSGEAFQTDRVILATGFDPKRPGGKWLDDAIAEYDLPIADCGYPIVDDCLQWREGLYTTGPLAELEVGPVARNIIGARLAAERIGRAV